GREELAALERGVAFEHRLPGGRSVEDQSRSLSAAAMWRGAGGGGPGRRGHGDGGGGSGRRSEGVCDRLRVVSPAQWQGCSRCLRSGRGERMGNRGRVTSREDHSARGDGGNGSGG